MARGATPDCAAPAAKASLAGRLLGWYGRHARALPWRVRGDAAPDPYAVWLSEIMLQQTTAAAVGSYFRAFLARWPRVEDLAAASLDEVLSAWAGLGYYARARNLHACARRVSESHGGRFPDTESALRALPGIGPYTAAALAAIAFARRAVVVDGNVERVVARLFAVETPLPGAKAELRRLAAGLLPAESSGGGPVDEFPYGDFAQAMMDLGATVCLPLRPRCGLCPLAEDCRARALGRAGGLPRRAPKRARPTRRGIAFWLVRSDGAVLLRRRADNGLLGGMMEVPSTVWRETGWTPAEAAAQAPLEAAWRALPGIVRHGFTHFRLELEVWTGTVDGAAGAAAGRWTDPKNLDSAGLPSVMRKVVSHALNAPAAP